MLAFSLRGTEDSLQDRRKELPPRMVRIHCRIVVDADGTDPRFGLLPRNVPKCGTIHDTLSRANELDGSVARKGG